MPTSVSSKKRLRQNVKHRMHNRSTRTTVRTQIKKVLSAIAAGNLEQSEKLYRLLQKKLDQAAAKNIIHRNAAARTKSRLSAKIKAAKGISDQ